MEYECYTDNEDPTITQFHFTANDIKNLINIQHRTNIQFTEEQLLAIADNLHSVLEEICFHAIDENLDKIIHEVDEALDEEDCPSEEVKKLID